RSGSRAWWWRWTRPIEVRARVAAAYESREGSYAEIASRFAVGSATVKRWTRRRTNSPPSTPVPARLCAHPRVEHEARAPPAWLRRQETESGRWRVRPIPRLAAEQAP